MNIVFASGKGGTGKTTVASNFAWFLAKSKQRVQYLDCDVEEPNGHLFLKPVLDIREDCTIPVPAIAEQLCTFCGTCGEKCQYHAIVNLPRSTLVFPEMCHGCGVCSLVCPEGAVSESSRPVGIVEQGRGQLGIEFVHGLLNVGEPMAVPLIRAVKAKARSGHVRVIDAPPGTSCPVVATMTGAHLVVLVTEPTPFGLHDLRIAVSVARNMGLPVGVVINRNEGTYAPLIDYLAEERLSTLAVIPEQREIAETCSRGELMYDALPESRDYFTTIAMNIGKLLGIGAWRKDHE